MGKELVPLSVREGSPWLFAGDRPFFWLGDTAWLLFHELTFEEICTYLRNRAEKGFNVIQAVAVHHLPAVNAYGKKAFHDENITRPQEGEEIGYWEIMDKTVKEAGRLGLYIALLPHWGSFAQEQSIDAMEQYMDFLTDRYAKETNVIWVTGGDTKGDAAPDYWRTMGKILRRKCPDRLITFHPFGRTSSLDYFPKEEWMDFHMFQSGHRRYDQRTLDEWDDFGFAQTSDSDQCSQAFRWYGEDNWRYVLEAGALDAVRPILDAEPSYEHIPQGLHQAKEPYWSREQVRRYGWWSVLAGACGFTYGHNSVMQFYRGKGDGAFCVKLSWMDALHAPACDDMVFIKKLMEPLLKDHWQTAGRADGWLFGSSIWTEEQKEERIIAFHAGNTLLCYTYAGKTIELDGGKICSNLGTRADYWWMNPETGIESYAGNADCTKQELFFVPPEGDASHKDWLLILRF